MDIHSLDYHTQDMHKVHRWLSGCLHELRIGCPDLANTLNNQHQKLWGAAASDQEIAQLIEWSASQKLFERHPNGSTTWSLRGVSFINSSTDPRLPEQQAWKEVALGLLRAQHLNNAPDYLFPYHIDEVLLFGSLTKSMGATYGDSDALLLMQPKSSKAVGWANKVLSCPIMSWMPQILGDPYFRKVAETMIASPSGNKGFCAWTSDALVVDVLADQDVDWALFNPSGRLLTSSIIAATQMDEVDHAIITAQKQMDLSQSTLLSQKLRKAVRALGEPRDALIQHLLLPALNQKVERKQDASRVMWWCALASSDALSQAMLHISDDMQDHWREWLDVMPAAIQDIWQSTVYPSSALAPSSP